MTTVSDDDFDATFIVYWTDYVANDWIQAVRGPWAETERRLRNLAEKGKQDFGMTIIPAEGNSSKPLTVSPITTVEEFFALDWAQWLDPEPEQHDPTCYSFCPALKRGESGLECHEVHSCRKCGIL